LENYNKLLEDYKNRQEDYHQKNTEDKIQMEKYIREQLSEINKKIIEYSMQFNFVKEGLQSCEQRLDDYRRALEDLRLQLEAKKKNRSKNHNQRLALKLN